ncbi:MAG: serine hydrolase domain-containing protein [Cypionkella sp.]
MFEQKSHSYWITSTGCHGFTGATGARFPYWSFTKTAISAAALKLAEAGVLDPDAPLSGQPYNLRQLLAHTSGLPDYGTLDDYHTAVANNEPPWPREKLIELARDKGPLFEPGQGWAYSNIGYMFVRELIEKVTAKPLGAALSDLLFKPLGLKSILLSETRAQFARLHWDAAASYDPGWVYHGCLTGTPADAARLLHALCVEDFLRPATYDQMRDTRWLGGSISGRPWTQCGYALGLMAGIMEGAGAAIGHSGGGPFSVNAVYHFPDAPDPVTVACFTDGTDVGVAEFAAAKLVQDQ